MFITSHMTRRVATGLVIAAAIVALTAPASALGAGHGVATQAADQRYGAPDGWTPYVETLTRQSRSANPVRDGRSPDTKDAASAAHAQVQVLVDGRSPDTKDASFAAHANDQVLIDGRSPDTRDFAALAHEPVVTVTQAPGFHWGDFGIGVAAAVGVVLAVALSIRLLRRRGRQPDTVATV